MANVMINNMKVLAFDASAGVDWLVDTIKVSLHTSTLTPSPDTHTYFSDLTNEVSGTGYTAGGATLGTKTLTQDNTNDRGVADAADTTWSASTVTARYAAVYKSTGTASTSPVIGIIDFGADKSSSATDFVIQYHASGIVYLG